MPLPSPLVGLTIRGRVIAADNTPIAGATVTLTPTVPARSPAGEVLVTIKARPKTSAADGTVEWTDLLATDSPGLSNSVPYTVTTVDSDGRVLEGPYTVELLSSQAVAGVLRLDKIAPTIPPVPAVSYVLASSVGAVGGPAGPLDATLKLPASQVPAGGATPDATTTSKGIVQLAGDLAGTAAAPTVPGLAGKQTLDADLTAIAALAPADGALIQRVAGAWASQTAAQIKASLGISYADVSGTVPTAALPPLAINETFVVADQAAMLALTAQRGDMAIRQDTGRTYVLTSDSPGTLADWKEVLAAGQVQSVAGKTGVVSLVKADVGLGNVDNTSDAAKPISTATQAALDAKAALNHSHAFDRLLSAHGFVAATGYPLDFGSTGTPGGNDHLIVLIAAPPGTTITAIKAHSNAAATYSASGVPAQCKAYDFDGALLGTSPDDPTLWLAGGWRTCTFAATFVVPANGLLYFGISFGGFTGASVAVPSGSPATSIFEGLTGGKRWAIFSGAGALPASFNPASYGLTTNWAPLIGVVAA